MAYIHDFAYTFLTNGCYLFATRPRDPDLIPSIIHTMTTRNPDVFVTVPWILHETMKYWEHCEERQDLDVALRCFKLWITGGAQMDPSCLEWAKERGLRLFSDIGMTETGNTGLYRFFERI